MDTLVKKLDAQISVATQKVLDGTDDVKRQVLIEVSKALQDMKDIVTSHIEDNAVSMGGVDIVFLLDLDSPTGKTLTESSEYEEDSHARRRTDR